MKQPKAFRRDINELFWALALLFLTTPSFAYSSSESPKTVETPVPTKYLYARLIGVNSTAISYVMDSVYMRDQLKLASDVYDNAYYPDDWAVAEESLRAIDIVFSGVYFDGEGPAYTCDTTNHTYIGPVGSSNPGRDWSALAGSGATNSSYINIFFCKRLYDRLGNTQDGIAGVAYVIGGTPFIIMNKANYDASWCPSGVPLAHEIGHVLGLLHSNAGPSDYPPCLQSQFWGQGGMFNLMATGQCSNTALTAEQKAIISAKQPSYKNK